MKKVIAISVVISVAIGLTWYLDPFHKPVESIKELEGQDYEFARKKYFGKEPDEKYDININKGLYEFHYGIMYKKELLLDSIVQVITWEFPRHKETIWVSRTAQSDKEIIDAIRYKDGVEF
ncbi:hypothetical protein [Rufibacter sp. LB8]|uniref:hypothetical protein n=1 Tax=Rufibacter sp. LB8 TaxID=2777781 RepID=UPI00178C5F87|nr:hypothetical protein [Rufibacter sp. LB8]